MNNQGDGTADINRPLGNEAALKQLANLESMIDIMSGRLVEFRGLGLNEFTLQEIRLLEGKLIKHFCQQLCTKGRVAACEPTTEFRNYPSLSKWLKVVGVRSSVANALKRQGRTVEDLLKLTDMELQEVVEEMGGDAEDDRKLTASLHQLRKVQSLQNQTKIQQIDTTGLYWDSWSKSDDSVFNGSSAENHDFNKNVRSDKECVENGLQSSSASRHDSETSDCLATDGPTRAHRTRSNTDPSNADTSVFQEFPTRHRNHQLNSTSSSSCFTPPSPSCHGSRSSLDSDSGTSGNRNAPSSSPPPHVSKLFVIPPSPSPNFSTPPVTPRTPQKNTHAQLQSSVSTGSKSLTRERVASTGAGTSLGRSNKIVNPNTLLPAFNNLKPSKSSEWHIGLRLLPHVNDSISASNQSLTSIASTTSQKRKPSKKVKKRPGNIDIMNDSDVPNFIHYQLSGVSRRSSTTISPENPTGNSAGLSPMSPRTPMTPATPYNTEMMNLDRELATRTPSSPQTPKTPKSGLKKITRFFAKMTKKNKPKRNKSIENIADDSLQQSVAASGQQSPSHSTLSIPTSGSSQSLEEHGAAQASQGPAPGGSLHPREGNGASQSRPTSLVDTDRTLIAESLVPTDTSTVVASDTEVAVDSEEESTITEKEDAADGIMQPMSEEWDIPYSELQIGDKIGSGRVGTVYRGRWHGEVAIRVIDINHNDEEKLKAFKQEIMIYKKTRHENLELFMGSCMNPPRLAIVTGLCKGQSLYNHIRSGKYQSVNINHAKIIGQHIVQGMGYLHSKGIIHKDLKSKNIFVDGKHVVLTDFGLVGLHAVTGDSNRRGSLEIPDGWLCHLAPEVILALRVPEHNSDGVVSNLPYTVKSDVFAFGTVWYELLSGSWPFNGYPAESIIWQVGSGKKQNLSQLQGGKDVKDILMQSWSYDPSRRPDFSDNGIMGVLKRLQNHIHRSLSSHPRRAGTRGSTPHLFDGTPLRHTQFSTLHDLAE